MKTLFIILLLVVAQVCSREHLKRRSVSVTVKPPVTGTSKSSGKSYPPSPTSITATISGFFSSLRKSRKEEVLEEIIGEGAIEGDEEDDEYSNECSNEYSNENVSFKDNGIVPVPVDESTIGKKRSFESFSRDYHHSTSLDSIYQELLHTPASTSCTIPTSSSERRKDRRQNRNRLRVASFNAEWLFLFGGSGSVKCPGRGCPWLTPDSAKNHLKRVASLITRLDADIVHLNEVEDCRVLTALMALLPSNHGYVGLMAPGTDTMTGQNVALLSRIDPLHPVQRSPNRLTYPISGSQCPAGKKRQAGTVGLSKHYLATIPITLDAGRTSFTLLLAGAHLLAQPGNAERCLRREAQALVLARLLQSASDRHESAFPGDSIEMLITGDFNDHDRDAPGASGELPRSSTLQILKRDCGRPLHSVATWIGSATDRYSAWHDRNRNCRDDGMAEHSLIDHVLVSEGLRRRLQTVWMDHNETVSCRERTSDHFPIILEIK